MTTPPPSTQPQPPAVPPGWEVLVERALEILVIERAAVALVAPMRHQFQAAMKAITAQWVREFGSIRNPATPVAMPAIRASVIRELRSITPDAMSRQVQRAVQHARTEGVRHAVESARDQIARTPPALPLPRLAVPDHPGGLPAIAAVKRVQQDLDTDPPPLDKVVRDEIGRLDSAVQERLTRAVLEARRLGDDARWSQVTAVLLRAQQAATGAEQTAGWAVNWAANQGAREMARRLGVERLWIGERNACARACLALSGTVSVNGVFNARATFAGKPLPVWPGPDLLQPPRHNRCRCRAEVWLGSAPGYSGPDLPAALRREAERSILSGWRVDSESESARIQAAKALLARGTNLPTSVQRRARAAILRGAFAPFPREPSLT